MIRPPRSSPLFPYTTLFRSEQRPFFVAGRGLFQFDVNCTAVNDCSTGEGLVYSRRIGRAPELAGTYQDTTSAAFTRIDRKSTRLNSSHLVISYAVFCLKKKK